MRKGQTPLETGCRRQPSDTSGVLSLTGQSTLEFAIVIFAVVAALLAMQLYIRRGIQGRLRQSADELSVQQYEPKNTVSDMTTTQNSDITTNTVTELIENETKYKTTTTTTINSQSENRSGTEQVLPEE